MEHFSSISPPDERLLTLGQAADFEILQVMSVPTSAPEGGRHD
jgi:hypothetical protein